MQSINVTICNEKGLHARAASRFAREAGKFKATIRVSLNDNHANGESIMGLMLLTASMGSEITISAEGVDETQALEALASLVSNRFFENS